MNRRVIATVAASSSASYSGAMEDDVRFALALRAYRAGDVRIADRDLGGCEHLVATRRGMFALGAAGPRLIAYGQYYGLTIRGDTVFAFEACDLPRRRSAFGRIVWWRHDGARIVATGVVATGLDNGCHQMDLIDGRLHLLDTYRQRILRFPAEGGAPETILPIACGRDGDWGAGYAHVNSLIADGDERLLLLHNGAERTGRRSEIARFDRAWRPLSRTVLDGFGCHGLAILEDGAILSCGSFAGGLVSTHGHRIALCDMMTRGLSVGDDRIVVGAAPFAERDARDAAAGRLFVLDRAYRRLGEFSVDAPPTDIRRIDGRDRGLSAYLASPG